MPRTDNHHPDFTRAHPELRWTGPLPGLFATLRDLAVAAPGTWQTRVLPGGAWVGLHRSPKRALSQALTLQVQRTDPFTTDDGERLFRLEVETFARLFNVRGWEVRYGTHPGGGPRATLRPALSLE